MKRLLAALLSASLFGGLVLHGVAHASSSASTQCAVCHVGKAVHAAADSPRPALRTVVSQIIELLRQSPREGAILASSARAPPAA
jgi:hypothetical protein